MGLRTKILGIVAVLSALLLASGGVSLGEAWAAWSSARLVAQVNDTTDKLFHAIEDWADEAVIVNTALLATDAADAKTLAAIRERRDRAEGPFRDGMRRIEADPTLVGNPQLVQAVTAARDKVEAFRREVDKAVALPRAQRDATLVKTWWPTIGALLDSTEDLWSAASVRMGAESPVVAVQSMVKQMAWLMRDFEGRERARLASALSARESLPPAAVYEVLRYQGRVLLAWDTIRQLSVSASVSARVRDAVETARTTFFGNDFQALRERVILAAAEGGAWPMTGQEWVAASNPALETLIAIVYASIEETEAYAHTAESAALRTLVADCVVLALTVVLSAASFWLVTMGVTRPLKVMIEAMLRLAEGDSAIEVPATGRRDEIGAMAKAIEVFRRNKIRADELDAQAETETAQRDERIAQREKATREFDSLMTRYMADVSEMAKHVNQASGDLNKTADRTSQQSGAVAIAAEIAADNIRAIGDATDLLSQSEAEMGRRITHTLRITSDAVAEIHKTNDIITGLNTAAHKIGEIVTLIHDIAAQTNLLALNASIEATRAGDLGHGFAVVAGEVKMLADQTAHATGDITTQVMQMQRTTESAVYAIRSIAATISRVDDVAATIAQAIEAQDQATRDIATNILEASSRDAEVTRNISEVSHAAIRTGRMAGDLNDVADTLSNKVVDLRKAVEGFLRKMRAM